MKREKWKTACDWRTLKLDAVPSFARRGSNAALAKNLRLETAAANYTGHRVRSRAFRETTAGKKKGNREKAKTSAAQQGQLRIGKKLNLGCPIIVCFTGIIGLVHLVLMSIVCLCQLHICDTALYKPKIL